MANEKHNLLFKSPPSATLPAQVCASSSLRTNSNWPGTPNTTNYLQVTSDFGSGNWQTIAMIIPATNSFTFVDPGAMNNPQRFYRLSLEP